MRTNFLYYFTKTECLRYLLFRGLPLNLQSDRNFRLFVFNSTKNKEVTLATF